MGRTTTCVWRADPSLVSLLDERLGPPVDSYVNGTQTWLTDDGPAGATLEWRLHPVAGYRTPTGLSHYDLWEHVVGRLSGGAADTDPPVASLWDGLECFAPYDEEPEPAPLAQAATEVLGRAPDASGLVDHDRIGAAWEQSRGAVSIVEMLFDELHVGA
ncbi:MAG TPA: hypothetical protein VH986_01075 [Acidimicrobiia bacterium]